MVDLQAGSTGRIRLAWRPAVRSGHEARAWGSIMGSDSYGFATAVSRAWA